MSHYFQNRAASQPCYALQIFSVGKRLVQLLILPLLLTAALTAQQEPVQIRFQNLSWDKETRWTELYYKNGETFTKLQKPLRVRSPEYRYTGEPDLTFYTKSQDAEGALLWEPIGRVNVAANHADWLFLMLAKQVAGKLRLQIYSMPDDVSDFPMGSYRVFNFTGGDMLVRLDKKVHTIAPTKFHTFDGLAVQDLVEFGLGSPKEDGQWKVSYNSAWEYNPNRRTLVIVTAKKDRPQEVDLKLIHEY
jgi:hypothetical protein